jgi:hypothetical protein
MVRLSHASKIISAMTEHLPQVLMRKIRFVREAVVAHGPSKSFLNQQKQPLRSHNTGSLKFPPLLECLAEAIPNCRSGTSALLNRCTI